jgi:metal-responsive CopG/Arc/MetJ family transcriptional regulator
MKTAVSLPEQVFRAAERHAKRTRKSRSQLYAEALSEYLDRHSPDEVTEAMNHVLDPDGRRLERVRGPCQPANSGA